MSSASSRPPLDVEITSWPEDWSTASKQYQRCYDWFFLSLAAKRKLKCLAREQRYCSTHFLCSFALRPMREKHMDRCFEEVFDSFCVNQQNLLPTAPFFFNQLHCSKCKRYSSPLFFALYSQPDNRVDANAVEFSSLTIPITFQSRAFRCCRHLFETKRSMLRARTEWFPSGSDF